MNVFARCIINAFVSVRSLRNFSLSLFCSIVFSQQAFASHAIDPTPGWVACFHFGGCAYPVALAQQQACDNLKPFVGPGPRYVAYLPDYGDGPQPICQSPDIVEPGGTCQPWACGSYAQLTKADWCPPGYLLNVYLSPRKCEGPGPHEEELVIRLSPASGLSESDTRLTSVEPASVGGTNITSLLARVYDQNNQLVPNAGVRLEVNVDKDSGGHHHHNNRPRGSLGGPEPTPYIITGNTGPNGSGFVFFFDAPPVGGDHPITAECNDGKNCTHEGPKQVWVGVKDLEHIPAVPPGTPLAAYQLFEPNGMPVGQTDRHPHNHFWLFAD